MKHLNTPKIIKNNDQGNMTDESLISEVQRTLIILQEKDKYQKKWALVALTGNS